MRCAGSRATPKRTLVRALAAVAAFVLLAGCTGEVGSEEDEEDVDTDSAAFAADECSQEAAPACPSRSTTEASGLKSINRCAFRINEKFSTGTVLGALEKIAPRVSLNTVLGDLNNTGKATTSIAGGPAGVVRGFGWESDDNNTTNWIPQGITGSADSTAGGTIGGKKVLLSSWYNKTGDKGVRIAIVDASGGSAKYRFALLVNPTGTAASPSFSAVKIHAGGLAWYGNYLYVVDTSKGFRVFDMSRILEVEGDSTKSKIGCSGGKCRAFDYRYVIPQVATYGNASSCSPRFSWVSLDRSTSPPSLVSGEWCDGETCPKLGGRVFRWELNSATGRINRAYPTQAYLMGQSHVQGGASDNGTFYFSSSKPAGTAGALYRVKSGEAATSKWANGPEDLMFDNENDLIYSQTENKPRAIFAVKKSSYPAP